MKSALPLLVLVLISVAPTSGAEGSNPIRNLAELTEPAKLRTLKDRAICSRFQKMLYWIVMAVRAGHSPESAIEQALAANGTPEPNAIVAKAALLQGGIALVNFGVLESDENLERMRHGRSPFVMRGPYRGETLHVDHVAPISRYPQLENEIGNLQLLPASSNLAKGNQVTPETAQFAQLLMEAVGAAAISAPMTSKRMEDALAQIRSKKLESLCYSFHPRFPPAYTRIGNELYIAGNLTVPNIANAAVARGITADQLVQAEAAEAKRRIATPPKQGVFGSLLRDERMRWLSPDVQRRFYLEVTGRELESDLAQPAERN